MALTIRVTPPKIDARVRLTAAIPAATKAAADVLLDSSKGGVPVEEGVLKASGRVEQDGRGAYITFGRDDDGDEHHAPSNQYVLVQHEDMDLNHPNGGGPKWLELTVHDEGTRAKALAEAAVVLRAALL